jgi:predicted AlkP superfamily phosphohydrolase/phosphomutase
MNKEPQTFNKNNKLIVLGLDGMPLDLVLSLMETGTMPNLNRLFQRGTYGNLRSVMPPITPAAWTSFQTGKYPFRHGVIDFVMFTPWTSEYSFTNSTHIEGQTLWNVLHHAGKKQIVVNVPLTYPPEEIDGIIIPGFDTPQTERANKAHPEGILDEIEQNTGTYPFLSLHKSIRLHREGGIRVLGDELLALTRSQVEAVKYLMKTYPWDLLMYHFQVTDIMQHSAWDLIDPNCKTYTQKKESDKDIVRDFYRSIDAMAGEIIEQGSTNVTVCLISDHGFSAFDTTFYLNLFLKEQGYISFNPLYPLLEIRDTMAKMFKKFNVPILKNRQLPPTRKVNRTFQKINFRKTTAYAYSNALNYAFVFVNKNLQVDTDRLKKDLMGLRHEGKPVIKDIYLWYEGRGTEAFNPDFVVEFSQGYSVKHRLPSRRYVLSRGYTLFEDATIHGNHSIDGMFCLAGGNIKSNYETKAEIVDIMPTILNILKVPTPKGIDGSLMEDVFVTQNELLFSDTNHYSTPHKTIGDADFDAVADMLKSLGYLQ